MLIFTTFPQSNKISYFLKQLPLNSPIVLVPTLSNKRLRILLVVERGLKMSSDNLLDVHDKI